VADVTPEELSGQIELSRQRFKQVIDQIRTVVVADVAASVPKAAKQAFLSQSAAADVLDDGQVAALKAQSTEIGSAASGRLAEALVEEAAWLEGADPPRTSAPWRKPPGSGATWRR